jgi:hypothetical protein
MAAGISTYRTFLMQGGPASSTATTYTKVIDITDFPDLLAAPDMLDTTSLSDGAMTSIPGIQSADSLVFNANYTLANVTAIEALMSATDPLGTHFSVWIGGTGDGSTAVPTGANGKYDFSGIPSYTVTGGGVNEVVHMSVTIALTSAIVNNT